MNKRGFTFIELLAIIILIGVVIGISIPAINYADKKFHEKDYNTKVELIKKAAEEYGDDNKETILYASGGTTYHAEDGNDYNSITVSVRDLLNNGYITSDTNSKRNDVKDPRDGSSMLDQTMIIYIKNNRAYVKLNF